MMSIVYKASSVGNDHKRICSEKAVLEAAIGRYSS